METKKIIVFLTIWVSNSIILIIVSKILGTNIVLGNDKISGVPAAGVAAFILTLAIQIAPNFALKSLKVKREKALPFIFLIVNFALIWIIKRFALVTGLGISSINYVIFLTAIVTAVEIGIGRIAAGKK